jgi:hypothetical protein
MSVRVCAARYDACVRLGTMRVWGRLLSTYLHLLYPERLHMLSAGNQR